MGSGAAVDGRIIRHRTSIPRPGYVPGSGGSAELRGCRAGVAVAARFGVAAGRHRRELASLVVGALQELQEHIGRLGAADRVLAVGDEERHAGDAVPRGLLLVGSYRVGVSVPVEDGLNL